MRPPGHADIDPGHRNGGRRPPVSGQSMGGTPGPVPNPEAKPHRAESTAGSARGEARAPLTGGRHRAVIELQKGEASRPPPFAFKTLVCWARSGQLQPTRYAGGDKRLYKATPPTDIDDCSGRQEFESKGWSPWPRRPTAFPTRKWMCKYHIVFTPKYRRKVIYNQIQERHRGDPQEAVRVQGDRDNRGAPDARPRARAAGDPAEVQRRERHGLPEGEELADDIRQARQPQSTSSATGSSGRRATTCPPSA